VLILRGEGFALMWPESAGPRPWEGGHAESVIRADLRRGMLYAPPDEWYHTHFNVSSTDATYVALTPRRSESAVQAFTGPGHNPEVESAEDALVADRPVLIPHASEDPMMQRLLHEGIERARSPAHATPPRP
jgi:hypothetical protein